MDSRPQMDSRLANLVISTDTVTAAVSDIAGASIVAGDVVFDMTKFAPTGEAVVVSCELLLSAGNVTATLASVGDDHTADFGATVATTASVVRVAVKSTI